LDIATELFSIPEYKYPLLADVRPVRIKKCGIIEKYVRIFAKSSALTFLGGVLNP
jgi:hypothetical protein